LYLWIEEARISAWFRTCDVLEWDTRDFNNATIVSFASGRRYWIARLSRLCTFAKSNLSSFEVQTARRVAKDIVAFIITVTSKTCFKSHGKFTSPMQIFERRIQGHQIFSL
jgi:hypothetical protein